MDKPLLYDLSTKSSTYDKIQSTLNEITAKNLQQQSIDPFNLFYRRFVSSILGQIIT